MKPPEAALFPTTLSNVICPSWAVMCSSVVVAQPTKTAASASKNMSFLSIWGQIYNITHTFASKWGIFLFLIFKGGFLCAPSWFFSSFGSFLLCTPPAVLRRTEKRLRPRGVSFHCIKLPICKIAIFWHAFCSKRVFFAARGRSMPPPAPPTKTHNALWQK